MHVAGVARFISTFALFQTLVYAQLYNYELNSTSSTLTASSNSASYSTPLASASDAIYSSSLPTTVLSVASRLPTTTPVLEVVSPAKSAVSEQTLGIILAAIICGSAILILIVVLACAFRRNADPERWVPYTRTPSPMGEQTTSGPLRAITARRIFSSRSANAPEVNFSEFGRRLSHSRKPSSLLRYGSINRGKAAALTDINESPQLTPLNKSTYSIASEDARKDSAEPRASRISLSRYHSRSVDVMDAASRYSTDGASEHRRSSTFSPERGSESEPQPLPISPFSPQSEITPPSPAAKNPFFDSSAAKSAASPLIPAKNPLRRQSPQVHYPSWNEVQDFDFNQANARRARPGLNRRSDSWKPGGDRASGRYELA